MDMIIMAIMNPPISTSATVMVIMDTDTVTGTDMDTDMDSAMDSDLSNWSNKFQNL